MEGTIGTTKRLLVVMMLLLAIIVVQAQEVLSPPPSPDASPKHGKQFLCPFKCSIKCLPRLKFGRIKYGLCLGLCLIGCIHSPANEGVYDCTEKCTVSKTTIYKPDSSYEVGSYVESCYEGCLNESIDVGDGS